MLPKCWDRQRIDIGTPNIFITEKEYSGCVVEFFRILASKDNYAAYHDHRAGRDMHTISLVGENSEVELHKGIGKNIGEINGMRQLNWPYMYVALIFITGSIGGFINPASADSSQTYADRVKHMQQYLPRIESYSYCWVHNYASKCDKRVSYIVYYKPDGSSYKTTHGTDYRNEPELEEFILATMVAGVAAFYDSNCLDGECHFR